MDSVAVWPIGPSAFPPGASIWTTAWHPHFSSPKWMCASTHDSCP